MNRRTFLTAFFLSPFLVKAEEILPPRTTLPSDGTTKWNPKEPLTDYETGAFIPAVENLFDAPAEGRYTRVGDTVHLSIIQEGNNRTLILDYDDFVTQYPLGE